MCLFLDNQDSFPDRMRKLALSYAWQEGGVNMEASKYFTCEPFIQMNKK